MARMSANEFDAKTKETMARRVGYRCSNPSCRVLTVGPNSDGGSATLLGEACHIAAASEKGPRFGDLPVNETRNGIENGIWLCRNCHKVVDTDVERYTPELLRYWKSQAEQRADLETGKTVEFDLMSESVSRRSGHHLRTVLLLGIFLVGLLTPVFFALVFKEPMLFWQKLICAAIVILGAWWFCDAIETRPTVAKACFGTLTEKQLYDSPEMIYTYICNAFGRVPEIPGAVPEGFHTYYRLRHIEFGSWGDHQMNFMRVRFIRCIEWYDPSVLYLHTLSKGGQAVKMLVRQGFLLKRNPIAASGEIDYLNKDNLHVFLSYKKSRFWRIKYLSMAEIFNCSTEEMIRNWECVHHVE